MCKENQKCEEYFQEVLVKEHEIHKNLPYTEEQLREIYRQNWEWKRSAPHLRLRLEPQQLDYDTIKYYLPEKWEMPRTGKLLYSDEELQQVLKLLMYNLGVIKSLDVIPRELIEQYLQNNDK